ncbi:MAG: hypothetical protein LIQ30_01045 [Planctomycetes bacterium]|nr:hypothetical protein [Planctomycetota bacterium]
MDLTAIYRNSPDVYSLADFVPHVVDKKYLDNLGVTVDVAPATLAGLEAGSRSFIARLAAKTVIPVPRLHLAEIDEGGELEVHNYTSRCPVLTYEVSPVLGCQVGCLYCLVTDGVHEQPLTVYTNYCRLLERVLEKTREEDHYFYYSAKTEAFQEPTLQTGIAHDILRTFIAHYHKFPNSRARLFIASKAGVRHLEYRHGGDSIIELFTRLKGKMQFNTSLSIMPAELRSLIEPYAAPIEERMRAVRLCQEKGILANSALVQPILPSYLTEERMRDFFALLRENNIINFKPEFLTVCMENLAWIGQLLGRIDPGMERDLYNFYLAPENSDHRKQRGRTAPNRDWSLDTIRSFQNMGRDYGVSTSICFWVRESLKISEDMIPIINENGFQCLGYQRGLFQTAPETVGES